MLEECAPGHTLKERTHKWCVMWEGRTFPSMPKGKHGRRTNPTIEMGHVRHMVRQLEISEDCAESKIEGLFRQRR